MLFVAVFQYSLRFAVERRIKKLREDIFECIKYRAFVEIFFFPSFEKFQMASLDFFYHSFERFQMASSVL